MLTQYAKGYRAGLDAVLLAAALRLGEGDTALEAGCGAGAVLLCAGLRSPKSSFTGLERDPRMAKLARQNVMDNEANTRISVMQGDVSVRTEAMLNAYDHVFSNPPYFAPHAIQTVGEGKEGAYLADTPLDVWLKFMLHAVRSKGRITLIHRAAALADILGFLNTRFGEIEVLPVRAQAGAPAKRILVSARKGLRKGEVLLHDGLTLYDGPDRQLSSRAQAVMMGGPLEWR